MTLRSVCFVALCLLCARAQAQANVPSPKQRWLLVPVLTTEAQSSTDAQKLTAPFEDALRKAGQEVITSYGAAAQFEQSHSAEPVKLDDDEMSRLLRRVGEAARHLALGELVQAQQAMEGVYALSGPARDFLNREAARAKKIFDNCLVAAYLWERGNEHPRALRQMLDCSRSFPGFRPEGRAYPPEMRELFEEATQRIGQMQSTTLLVQSAARVGCGVRLNGIEVGKSPMSFSDVRSGATRVQLECEAGVPGRIHEMELVPGENHLMIDPEFDRVVRTRGALWLEYVADEERKRRADVDALEVAKALRAERVVQLRVADATGMLRVSVRPMSGEGSKELMELSFHTDTGYDPALVAAVVLQLLRREDAPLLTAAPAEQGSTRGASPFTASDELTASELHDEPGVGPSLALGVPLAVVGGGGMIAGWVLYANRQDTRRALYPSGVPLREVDSFHNGGTASLLVSGLGAAVFTASDYFWLPQQEGVPAWAWGVGGAGAALALVGAGFALMGEQCDIADPRVACQGFTADSTFGPTLVLDSLPLLGVPLTYFLRESLGTSDARVSMSAGDRHAAFSLEGRF